MNPHENDGRGAKEKKLSWGVFKEEMVNLRICEICFKKICYMTSTL